MLSTDEAPAYKKIGYKQINGIESVWAVLKRMHYGTYHHFSRKHLARYVNECAFRLNEGNVRVDTIDRLASLCDMTIGKKLSYMDLIL